MPSDFTSAEALFSCSYMSVSACRDIACSFIYQLGVQMKNTHEQTVWSDFKDERVLPRLSGAPMGEFTVKQSTESLDSHTPFPFFSV